MNQRSKAVIRPVDLGIALVYSILAIGSLTQSSIIQIIGVAGLLLFLMGSTIDSCFFILIAMTPNLGVISINNGYGLLGIAYLIVLLKLLLHEGFRVKISGITIFLIVYILVLTATRIISNSNYYDFALVTQIIISILIWNWYINSEAAEFTGKIIDYYYLGCILFLFGMVAQYFMLNGAETRFRGICDDANYSGCVFLVLFTVSLIFFMYRLVDLKKNLLMMLVAVLGGLATASRGFILSVGVVVVFLSIIGTFGKREKRILLVIGLGMLFFIVSYMIGFGPVVRVYDETIGRTINLQNQYQTGNFMDVTSGRIFLWNYYIDFLKRDKSVLLFGRGFYQYYLRTNGGYGLAAHNAYISSVIGVGITGTLALLMIYFIQFRNTMISGRKKRVCLSIVLGVLVDYFFLDGILDLRLPLVFFLSYVVMAIVSNQMQMKA